jgi:predicted HTH domain antitoxin
MCELRTEEITKFTQTANQIMNDLSVLFFEEESVDLGKVEMIILNNLDESFTRTRAAELAGISIRTLSNKMNERV